MAQVARRRADQLGDFVLQLELAAVDFDHVLFRTVQGGRQGLRRSWSCLVPVGPSNRKDAHRAAFRRQSSLEIWT